MNDHITIEPAVGTWVVRSGGAVLGESRNALILREGEYDPVIYFPRDDIAMALLDRSDKITHCPHKGDASYFSIVNRSSIVENAVWSYENPIPAMGAIRDHLAFHDVEGVTVERV